MESIVMIVLDDGFIDEVVRDGVVGDGVVRYDSWKDGYEEKNVLWRA